MLSSLTAVHEGFFAWLQEKPIVLSYHKQAVPVPVRYASESGDDLVEAQKKALPCVWVQDYTPEFAEGWNRNFQPRFDDFRDTDSDGTLDTAARFEEPYQFSFRYDVGFISSKFMQRMAFLEYWLKTFGERGVLWFDKQVLESGEILGVPASYKVIITDVERSDGKTELNFEVRFSVFVHIREPQDVALVQRITLNI